MPIRQISEELQVLQGMLGSIEYAPLGQGTHWEISVAPLNRLAVPSGHKVQFTLNRLSLYVPGGQNSHWLFLLIIPLPHSSLLVSFV